MIEHHISPDIKRYRYTKISKFGIFKSLNKPKIINCVKFGGYDKEFFLFEIQYSHFIGIPRNFVIKGEDKSSYLFGSFDMVNDCGKCIITPKSFSDKVVDLLQFGNNIDKEYKRFSKRFFLKMDDPAKFKNVIGEDAINYIYKLKPLALEVNNQTCFFRINDKSLTDKKDIKHIVEVGFELIKYFDLNS